MVLCQKRFSVDDDPSGVGQGAVDGTFKLAGQVVYLCKECVIVERAMEGNEEFSLF